MLAHRDRAWGRDLVAPRGSVFQAAGRLAGTRPLFEQDVRGIWETLFADESLARIDRYVRAECFCEADEWRGYGLARKSEACLDSG